MYNVDPCVLRLQSAQRTVLNRRYLSPRFVDRYKVSHVSVGETLSHRMVKRWKYFLCFSRAKYMLEMEHGAHFTVTMIERMCRRTRDRSFAIKSSSIVLHHATRHAVSPDMCRCARTRGQREIVSRSRNATRLSIFFKDTVGRRRSSRSANQF